MKLVSTDYSQMELRMYHKLTEMYLPWYKKVYYWLLRHILPKKTLYKLMYGGRLFCNPLRNL